MSELFPELPADFGRYRILRKLGEGGMGAVYLAEDTKLRNRKTAIKIPTRKLTAENAARFQREAEASAVLEHPNICTVYDVGSIDGQQYLAMKFVEGRPLSDGVGKGRMWQPEVAVQLVIKIAEALQFAHDQGIIHRDIKPANIMLTANGEPILMDFGLAKVSGDPTMTAAGAVFGTPNYMPLEQARGDLRKIGPHSDVYSLGVILFQMLTGELPFTGDSAMDVFAKMAMDDVPQLRENRPDADEQLEAVLFKAMAKQVKDRYATMRQFADALANCQRPVPVTLPAYPHSTGNLSLSVPVEFGGTAHPRPLSEAERGENPVGRVEALRDPTPTTSAHVSGLAKPRPDLQTDESRTPQSTTQERPPARWKLVGAGLLAMLVIGVAVLALQPGETPKDKIAVVTTPTKTTTQPPVPEPKKEPLPTPEVKKQPEKAPPAPPPMTVVVPMIVPKPAPTAGEERSFDLGNGVKMVFCFIPKGECQLGSPKAERDAVLKAIKAEKETAWLASEAEEVRGKFTTNGFWLGKTEVTQEQWTAIMGTNPSYLDGKQENEAKGLNTTQFPVEQVRWGDCQEFLLKLNQRGGTAKVFDSTGKFTLPHEDQWEYAIRGGVGNKRPFYWGNSLNGDRSNCDGNFPFGTAETGDYKKRPTPVGSYALLAPHPWGLSDMSGNVWEWCDNKYSNDSAGRVVRGGSWTFSAWNCRSASRGYSAPDNRFLSFGFRVCVVLD